MQVTIKPAPGAPGEKDQVTVKPAPGIPGERDQLPLVSSPTSKDSQKHAKSHVVASVHPQKDSQASTQSSMLQPKQGYGSTHASSIPEASMHSTVVLGSSSETPSLAPVITTSDKGSKDVPVGSSEALFPDAIKAQQEKPGDIDPSSVQDQVFYYFISHLLNKLSVLVALSKFLLL